jgi:hypothetical protein
MTKKKRMMKAIPLPNKNVAYLAQELLLVVLKFLVVQDTDLQNDQFFGN